MKVGRLCSRTVHTADRSESVLDAARRMRDHDVGTLLVVDLDQREVGMVTDRDIVVRCVAEGLDPAQARIRSVMSAPVATVPEEAEVEDAVRAMVVARVRRLVVVDRSDAPVGIVSVDDVMQALFEEGADISRLLQLQGPEG